MKKSALLALIVLVAVLCLCFAACDIFKKPNPDDGDDQAYDLSKLQVSLEENSYFFDGQEHTPTATLFDGKSSVATVGASAPHNELDVTYADNVQIGQASVTIRAKSGAKRFEGSVTVYFKISANDKRVEVADFASLKERLQNYFCNVALSADVEIPPNETLTVPANAVVDLNKHCLVNRGEVTVQGELQLGANGSWSDAAFDLVNYGKLETEQESKILFRSGGNVVNHGSFLHEGQFARHSENFGDNYVYSDSELSFTSSQYVKVCVRTSIGDDGVTLAQDSFPYTGKAVLPLLNKGQKDVDYTVSCADDVDAGKYAVTFTATEHSNYFYGERSFEYEINKVAFDALTENAFLKVLENSNYSPVNFYPTSFKLLSNVEVSANVTVNVGNCSITNLKLTQNSTLNAHNCTFSNVDLADGSNLNVSKETMLYKNVTGKGALNVLADGELFFGAEAEKPSVSVTNLGKVYANFTLDGVTGSGEKTVRRQLADGEITAENLDYTGENLRALPTFAHSEEGNFGVYYLVEGEFSSNKYPKARGAYQAEVRFGDKNKYYFGSASFSFQVVKGAITVTDTTTLKNAIENGNYDRFRIAEWRLSAPFEIPAGSIVLAEKVVNNSQITVYGTLSVGDFTNNPEKSLTVVSGGLLQIRGNFYNVEGTSRLTLQDGSAFENVGSGAVYLCDTDDAAITGQKYIRTANLAEGVFEGVSEARYGENVTPTFTLRHGDVAVSDAEFLVSYLGNFSRTEENGAKICVTAKVDSRIFYGQAECRFTVWGGKIVVNSGDELLSALNNMANEDGLCNYERIETGKVIQLKANNQQGRVDKYHLCKGTTLVLNHNIEIGDIYPHPEKYSFQNNGVIQLHNGARLEDAYLWQKNGTGGQLHLFVSERAQLVYYSGGGVYDYVCLENDLYVESGASLYVQSGASGLTVDLNGHTIKGIADKTVFEIITGGNKVTVLNGTVQPKLKIVSNAEGQVLLQNVTYGEIDDPNHAVQ